MVFISIGIVLAIGCGMVAIAIPFVVIGGSILVLVGMVVIIAAGCEGAEGGDEAGWFLEALAVLEEW